MPTLSCAFGVWLAWSVITSKIQLMHDKDPTVYPFQDYDSPKGKAYNSLLYTLPAVAGLSGGTLRLANSFMTPIVGGRNAVHHSSIIVMLAMILTAWCLKSPTAPFNSLLIAAWLSGTGGGAFSSSMANMSHFYPKRQQGYSLGFNAGLGNLGVSVSQLLVGLFMSWSFGQEPISDKVDGWPNHGTLCYVIQFYSRVHIVMLEDTHSHTHTHVAHMALHPVLEFSGLVLVTALHCQCRNGLYLDE
jgi:MFS transporter, NNP family, nitrate/nitrite transporter